MDAQRAARIRQLSHIPAFAELAEELAEAEAKYWRRHVADVKNGAEIDQRELDFMRGRFSALTALLKQPERAATIMERSRKQQEEATASEVR